MNPKFIRDKIIKPTLEYLSPEVLEIERAIPLLLGTCAQESHLGRWRMQTGGGPAMGIWQIEPATEKDVWKNYLLFHPSLAELVNGLRSNGGDSKEMMHNDFYSCAIARIIYLRDMFSLPKADDLASQAIYYKRVYNTVLGAATPEQYVNNWFAMVEGRL